MLKIRTCVADKGTIAKIARLIKFAIFFISDANHERIQGTAFQS
jgi:hypothetical protein